MTDGSGNKTTWSMTCKLCRPSGQTAQSVGFLNRNLCLLKKEKERCPYENRFANCTTMHYGAY